MGVFVGSLRWESSLGVFVGSLRWESSLGVFISELFQITQQFFHRVSRHRQSLCGDHNEATLAVLTAIQTVLYRWCIGAFAQLFEQRSHGRTKSLNRFLAKLDLHTGVTIADIKRKEFTDRSQTVRSTWGTRTH